MTANPTVTNLTTSPVRLRAARPVVDPAVRAVARTAPRGAGLATVVALPVRREIARPPTPYHPVEGASEVATGLSREWGAPLRSVPAPTRRTRTAVRAGGLLVAVFLSVAGILVSVMMSGQEPVAAGHVVLQPGETLWDVAVRSAPAGVDPRRQLDVVRRLNGFGPGALDAWTVVLIPAP